jgi:hypothetical protein
MSKTIYTVESYYGDSMWEDDFQNLNDALYFIKNLPHRKSFNGSVLPFTLAKVLKNNTYLNNIPVLDEDL